MGIKQLLFGSKQDFSTQHYLAIHEVRRLLEHTISESYDGIILVKRKGAELTIDAEGFSNDEAILWLHKAIHRLDHEDIFGA